MDATAYSPQQQTLNTSIHSNKNQAPKSNSKDSTQKAKPPTIKNRPKAEITITPEGKRFRNGRELGYDTEDDSDNSTVSHEKQRKITSTNNSSSANDSNQKKLKLPEKQKALAISKHATAESSSQRCLALIAAINCHDTDTIQRLVEQDRGLVTAANRLGIPFVLNAVKNKQEQTAEILIKNGFYLNDEDADGNTALMLAAKNGNSALLKSLIQAGADINHQNSNLDTALHLAIDKMQQESVKLLLGKKIEINTTNKNDFTPLMIAIHKGHTEIVHLLITNGAAVNHTNSAGETALMRAAISAHTKNAKLLIENGALLNTQNHRGFSAIEYAAEFGQIDMVKLLIEHGATFAQLLNPGWSAVKIAVKYDRTEIAKFLVEKEASIDPRGESCSCRMVDAIQEKNAKYLKFLVNNDNRFLRFNSHRNFQKFMSAHSEKVDMLKILLQGSVQVNHCDVADPLLIIEAVKLGNIDIIKLLIEHGALIDQKNIHGETALMHAVKEGRAEIVKLLIDSGSYPDQVTKDNKTLLQVAIEKNDPKLIVALLSSEDQNIGIFCDTNFKELGIALKQPDCNPFIIDLLLDFQSRSNGRKGKYTFNQLLDGLSKKISDEFAHQANTTKSHIRKRNLVRYLCKTLGWSYGMALAMSNSVFNVRKIYANTFDGNTPTPAQIKIAIADLFARAEPLQQLVQGNADTLLQTGIQAGLSQAKAKEMARSVVVQADLITIAAETTVTEQKAAIKRFFLSINQGTTSVQIKNVMRDAGWHPVVIKLVNESWESINHQKTAVTLNREIKKRMETEEFITEIEGLASDEERLLIHAQLKRISEIFKM